MKWSLLDYQESSSLMSTFWAICKLSHSIRVTSRYDEFMYSWIKVSMSQEQPGSTNQQIFRNLNAHRAAPMTVREATLIVANANGGLFPAADIGILAVIDEAQRTIRAARSASRSDLLCIHRGRAITGVLIGAATVVIGTVIWFIPIATHLAG
ncbi:hypothetical protein E3O19_05005 [Cryobacterium algoritolerans]|uniref:Uncharacterized protein n=1 Tax=Cryobacterium algoritolerans TaxID=1259184 RepID=A0A4R8WVH8_9MICO|nr:hypothetical protein [Cryobacterium algoritolerans]TFC18173.1 hypothetical protein E3O19_05005 [Cryobacterium algoritolerans]